MPEPIEFGKLIIRIQNLEHRARNDRMVIHLLEDEIDKLQLDLERFKIKITTAVAVTGLFISGIAWVLESQVF
jgi:hypothetical protein